MYFKVTHKGDKNVEKFHYRFSNVVFGIDACYSRGVPCDFINVSSGVTTKSLLTCKIVGELSW